jgi:hypothetical protein
MAGGALGGSILIWNLLPRALLRQHGIDARFEAMHSFARKQFRMPGSSPLLGSLALLLLRR